MLQTDTQVNSASITLVQVTSAEKKVVVVYQEQLYNQVITPTQRSK